MNRNLLPISVASVLLTGAMLFATDGWIYATTFVIAVAIIKIIRYFHSGFWQVTRWAKQNPRKTQVLITVLQILILSLGLLVGYDLKKLGYQIGGTPILIFGFIVIVGFLSIPFIPKKNIIVLPVVVNKDRIAYLSIALSAFVLMVITGNRIEDKYPDSFIAHSLRSADQAIFSQAIFSEDEMYSNVESDIEKQQEMLLHQHTTVASFASFTVIGDNSGSSTIHPSKEASEKIKAGKNLEKKKKKMMKRLEKLRKAFAAGATAGTVLLIILLVITTCAGICLIAIGGSVGAVAAGVVLTGLSVWAFIRLMNKNKRTNKDQ